MYICSSCNKEISQDRIEAFLEFRGCIPEQCKDCSTEQKAIGFMGESTIGGDKSGRKNGYVLIKIDPNAINFKENLRRAKRCHQRAR